MSPGPERLQYPHATIAAYGPDNTLATKLVVAVFKRPGQKKPSELHRWITAAGDVRNDETIAIEVVEFLKLHHVTRTITYDRIIGCPHEEGIDYPLGGKCPCCPFWANRDRFTHAVISPTGSPEAADENTLVEPSVDRTLPPGLAGRGGESGLPPASSNPPSIGASAKVGRNDPCPCGSGKKFKKCCGR